MSIMAKTPSGYKKIGSAYLGERPVDKVFNANGDVVYALQRELTGVPPLLFKGKEQSDLLNYRIYGDTVDGNSVGDLVESGEHAGEYKVPVTVEGKNLFSGFIRGIRLNTGTGIEESNGTSYTTDYLPVEANMLYTYSGGSDRIAVALFAYDSLKKYIGRTTNVARTTDIFWMSTNISGLYTTFRSNLTGNNNPIKYIRVTYVNAGDSLVNAENIMLNSGSTALPYEPYHAPVTTPIYLPEPIKMVGDEAEYIDYAEQKLHRVRKNLLSNMATDRTTYGVTITVNDDGSVTCNGTATSTIVVDIFEKELGQNTYILSGCPENGALNERYKIQMNSGDGWYADIGNGLEFEIQNTSTIKVRFVIYPSYTCDNLTFYPMIRKADIEDDTYEPYIENTELDVTLPALPTIKGTNTMSIDTTVQPSRMDIKGRIKTLT